MRLKKAGSAGGLSERFPVVLRATALREVFSPGTWPRPPVDQPPLWVLASWGEVAYRPDWRQRQIEAFLSKKDMGWMSRRSRCHHQRSLAEVCGSNMKIHRRRTERESITRKLS